MRLYCWISKVTDTLGKCNTYYFQREQLIPERASLLRFP